MTEQETNIEVVTFPRHAIPAEHLNAGVRELYFAQIMQAMRQAAKEGAGSAACDYLRGAEIKSACMVLGISRELILAWVAQGCDDRPINVVIKEQLQAEFDAREIEN